MSIASGAVGETAIAALAADSANTRKTPVSRTGISRADRVQAPERR